MRFGDIETYEEIPGPLIPSYDGEHDTSALLPQSSYYQVELIQHILQDYYEVYVNIMY